MKIVYDNIIFSLQKAGGISVYWAELIKRLSLKKENILFFEFGNKNIFRKELILDTVQEINLSVKILRYLPIMKRLPSKSIFHSSYYRTSLQKDIVKIVTVYDFTYEHYRGGIARYIHSWQKNFAINNADGVICISHSTKNDLLKFFPNIDKQKIKTIYISAGEEFHKLSEINNLKLKEIVNKKVILYVGDRKSSYKNFKLAVDVVSRLKEYVLVSVGGGKITSAEEAMISSMVGKRFFSYLGITSEELNILYNTSHCLLYPSSYEGFGIPVLEAMRAGCPVVSTNFSSIPEVSGDAGILVDEITEKRFMNEIKKLENDQFRLSCIEKGLIQATKFSWDKCFNETYDFYKEVYNRKFNK